MNAPRPKKHLINELPHLYEIDDMLEFCEKYERLFICGAAENQEYLLKYFDICGVKIEGYAVTNPEGECLRHYRSIPIFSIDDVIRQPGVGVILALSSRHYRHFIPKFRKAGFRDYFVMTEYNKQTIAEQLKPRPLEEMTFEVSLAEHCNLSCQCCDHFSQLAAPKLLSVETYAKDIARMSELFRGRLACVTLLGGEPTLHPELIRFFELTRKAFPDAEIVLLTNGLLLPALEHGPNGNVWEACREYDVEISVTIYPIRFDYDKLEQKGKEYGVTVGMSSDVHASVLTRKTKISDKHTMDLTGQIRNQYCVGCLYFNKFMVLKEGRIYPCPIAANIHIFNAYFNQNIQLQEDDCLDIYAADSWKDVNAFGATFHPICKYCNLPDWGPFSEWKPSEKCISEYV